MQHRLLNKTLSPLTVPQRQKAPSSTGGAACGISGEGSARQEMVSTVARWKV